MNLQNLVNLTPILAVLATLAGSGYSTSGLLTWMRKAALNAWLSGLDDDQRAAIYQGIMLVLNYLIIGGLALTTHYTLSWNLAGSVLVAALASTIGAHGLYNYNQKPASMTYAEIPVGTGSDVNNAGAATATDASTAGQ